MSEKLLKILLSELATARVICKRCSRGVVEVSLDRLDDALDQQGHCRFCNSAFAQQQPGGKLKNPLREFRMALEELRRLTDLEIEFVLPDKSG